MPSETSQTLDRGLRVLRVLAESPEGLTVTEVAGRLAVNRTVVHRLVSTLEQHGLVRRDARSRLFVGLGVLHLASAVQPLLRDLAMPVLRSLAKISISLLSIPSMRASVTVQCARCFVVLLHTLRPLGQAGTHDD